MMKINFVGAVHDSNGYAEFARTFVSSMHKAGADLSVEQISFEREHINHGAAGELCTKLMLKKHNKIDVNIINMVPKVFNAFKKKNAFNIGFTMFETTKIPDIWVEQCNQMDAILVPCQWNKEVFENSGVKVPVRVANPALNEIYYTSPTPTTPRAINGFSFYSIFQWTERKAPLTLLEAYWKEFSGDNNVRLVLKTYRRNYTEEEFNIIKQEILKLKVKTKLSHYPGMVPLFRKMSSQEIINTHLNNDCFVLPHRAEGWGMPHAEAMALGKPVITTGFSGNMDFMTDDNSLLLKKHKMVPVGNMDWIGPWYDSKTMQWAEPDVNELREKMRYVYEHRDEAKAIGERARNDIHMNFSQEKCGENILEVIRNLYSNGKRG